MKYLNQTLKQFIEKLKQLLRLIVRENISSIALTVINPIIGKVLQNYLKTLCFEEIFQHFLKKISIFSLSFE